MSGCWRCFGVLARSLVGVALVAALGVAAACGGSDDEPAVVRGAVTEPELAPPVSEDPIEAAPEPEPLPIVTVRGRALERGSEGLRVEQLQAALVAIGLLAEEKASGRYDAATERAVAVFQEQQRLRASGRAGKRTLEALNAFVRLGGPPPPPPEAPPPPPAGTGDAPPSPPLPARAGRPPRVARILCDVNGTQVATPEVRRGSDGVTLHVTNVTGRELPLLIVPGPTGLVAPPGESEHLVALPPGEVYVACASSPPGPIDLQAAFTVMYEQAVPLADTEQVSANATLDPNATGTQGTPKQAVREQFTQPFLRDTDVLERVSVRRAQRQTVHALRDRQKIAEFTLVRSNNDGWLLESWTVCAK